MLSANSLHESVDAYKLDQFLLFMIDKAAKELLEEKQMVSSWAFQINYNHEKKIIIDIINNINMNQLDILYFILNRLRKKTQIIIKEAYRRIDILNRIRKKIQMIIKEAQKNLKQQQKFQGICLHNNKNSFRDFLENSIIFQNFLKDSNIVQDFLQNQDSLYSKKESNMNQDNNDISSPNPKQKQSKNQQQPIQIKGLFEDDDEIISIQDLFQNPSSFFDFLWNSNIFQNFLENSNIFQDFLQWNQNRLYPEKELNMNNKGVEFQSTVPLLNQSLIVVENQQKEQSGEEFLIYLLQVQKLKNTKLIEFDHTIKVLQVLDNFLKQKQLNQLDQVITEISNVQYMIENQQYNEKDTIKIKKNFEQFKKKQFYDVNKFKPKRFLSNIYNIIASQLILQEKTICKQKLEECYFQLSKNWINLLDFTKTETENKKIKKENKYQNQKLQNFLNLLRNNNNSEISENVKYFQNKHYGKYSFLEIALNLLQILKIQWNDDKIRDNIFELLKEVVLKKQKKYESKRAINFTKQDIIDLMYKKENNREVVDEEVITEIQQLLEGPIIYPQE
ncbi:unnamed protein product [Paramecium pentaurelia]|uniref:Uncharacterized protein n=1 Tax=Paramecium pentaurelia TaxID=43138 RepID=A0A8S1YDC2_9CILI|nr:unnamed protein product [Paramecium pentaurelia]